MDHSVSRVHVIIIMIINIINSTATTASHTLMAV